MSTIWSGSRDSLLHFGAQAISLERMKLDISNLVCRLNEKSTGITHVKVLQHGVHLNSGDLLKVWKISANISETVRDRHMVTILLKTNRKSHVSCRMAPISMTLTDLECHFSLF